MEKDNVIPFLLLLFRAAGRSENLEGQAVIEEQLMEHVLLIIQPKYGEGAKCSYQLGDNFVNWELNS